MYWYPEARPKQSELEFSEQVIENAKVSIKGIIKTFVINVISPFNTFTKKFTIDSPIFLAKNAKRIPRARVEKTKKPIIASKATKLSWLVRKYLSNLNTQHTSISH